MVSSKCLLPRQLGVLSKLTSPRAEQIRIAAQAAAAAYASENITAWELIIDQANRDLTKYERGFFSGILYGEVGK